MAAGVLTAPRVLLGARLRHLRTQSGTTLDDLAAATGKSRTRLIHVLDGTATLTAAELERALDFLKVASEQKRHLLHLGDQARKRQGRRTDIDHIPPSFRRSVGLQTIATHIQCYERSVIPVLLQTSEYALALMADGDGIWWEPSPTAFDEHFAFVRTRHKLVMETGPPKILHFIITDDALRTEVGEPPIMQRQLQHILRLIDEKSTVTIQVLPVTASHNPAPGAGMTLLGIGPIDHAIALLPVLSGPPLVLDDPHDTTRLSKAFNKVSDIALGIDESQAFIGDLTTRSASSDSHTRMDEDIDGRPITGNPTEALVRLITKLTPSHNADEAEPPAAPPDHAVIPLGCGSDSNQ